MRTAHRLRGALAVAAVLPVLLTAEATKYQAGSRARLSLRGDPVLVTSP